MIYLQLSRISKSYDNIPLLSDVDLTIQKGDRVGLVGPNGVGKTAILKIARGDILPDAGTLSLARDIKVGYLSQEDKITSDYTLFLAMIESYHELLEIKSEMDELQPHLSAGAAADLSRYGELQLKWEHLGGYSFETDIKNTLVGLGFNETDLYRPVKSFSGGEKNRAALARILLHKPDLLLLDEPTNHLDIESTIWLEEYLASFAGAVLLVSHDRILLDHVTNKIVELEDGRLELYHGNFSRFWQERAERRRLRLKQYLEQKEEIARIEDFIRRNIAGQKTKQAQSRRRSLGKMEQLHAPITDSKKPALNLEVSRRSYLSILEVDNLTFGFGERTLFDQISFKIERGEKVGLIGPNGSGKSTLVRLIIKDLETASGTITVGRNVDIEYFDQELAALDPELSVLDTIWNVRPDFEAFQLRSYLARFLFVGEDVFKLVKMLSGGEKKKLALAQILAHPANFLILDEPTNHLDIASLDALQESLREYNGTLLFISHDRHFLDKVATRIIAISNRMIIDRPGNYSEFVAYQSKKQTLPVTAKKGKRDAYHSEKREKNMRSARRKRIKELELLIREEEAQIERSKAQLVSEEYASDWEKLNAIAAAKKEQEARLNAYMKEYYRLREEDETADS
ncbi:MAG: ABC-F family ATP-binding cassette domain-containing protein [candidate division Zixibacteria bacterium]|nr:ABC-F family ATP-binding cassette domain-containing protein [candidate division Zixibacteria bacterium]